MSVLVFDSVRVVGVVMYCVVLPNTTVTLHAAYQYNCYDINALRIAVGQYLPNAPRSKKFRSKQKTSTLSILTSGR